MRVRSISLLITIAATAPMPVLADVSIHGFGQVVAGSTLGNDHTVYGETYGADPSFDKESLFGLQVQAPLSDSIEATAQMVASSANGNDYTPKFEWAYASYFLGEHWIIKGGRQRLPLYRYSDYLEEGQDYPWIRPPLSVYQGILSNYDGLSATGYYEFGKWTLQPELIYGNADQSGTVLGSVYGFDFKNITGLILAGSYSQWLNWRGSIYYSTGSISVSEFQGLTSFVLPYSTGDNSAVIAGLSPNDHSVVFYSGALDFHPGKFTINGEYVGARFNDTAIYRYNEYYISSGYHFGKLMPNLTFGHVDTASSDPGLVGEVAPGSQCPTGVDPTTGQPSSFVPCVAVVSQIINAQRQQADYYEAGLRYDLTPNTALKFDWTRYLAKVPLGEGVVPTNHEANLVSVAFTFVF